MLLRHFLKKLKNTSDEIYSRYLMSNFQGQNHTYEEWTTILDLIKKSPV